MLIKIVQKIFPNQGFQRQVNDAKGINLKSIFKIQKYYFFKSNVDRIYQLERDIGMTISQFSRNQVQVVQDKGISKRIAKELNDLIERMYEEKEKIDQNKQQQIESDTQSKKQSSENEKRILSESIENRLLLLSKKKMSEDILRIGIDLLLFSLEYKVVNDNIAQVFSHLLSHFNKEQLQQFKIQSIQVLERMIKQNILNGLIVDFNDNYGDDEGSNTSSYLILMKHLLDISDNIDIQISLYQYLLQISQNTKLQSSSQEAAAKQQFISSFAENQFYELWLQPNSNEYTSNNNTNLVQNSRSKYKQLLNYIYDNIFESFLLKRDIGSFKSFMNILNQIDAHQLSSVPAENYLQQASKLANSNEEIIMIMEKCAQLQLFPHQIKQKLVLYSGLCNQVIQNEVQIENESQMLASSSLKNQSKLKVKEVARILKILGQVGISNHNFIQLFQEILNRDNSWQKLKPTEFLMALNFFSKYPIDMNIVSRGQVNFYIKSKFNSFGSQLKLSLIQCILKLENFQENKNKLSKWQNPTFCTIDNMGEISDFLIQYNASKNKSLQERIQFYFLLRTFFRDEVIINEFEEQNIEDLKDAFIRAGIVRISEFQKQVLDDLLKQDIQENGNKPSTTSIQQEAFIENIFAVDYLINSQIVLEVNGPQHYFYISNLNESLFQQSQKISQISDAFHTNKYNVLENRNTMIKSSMLSQIGYQVKSIPIDLYQQFQSLNKQQQFVYEAVYSKSRVQDLFKLL